MKSKLPAPKLAAAMVGCLAAVLLLEGALRIYASVVGQERTLRYDSIVGWKLIPNTRRMYRDEAQPYQIEISSQGLRDVEHSRSKPTGVFRIVVMGDSFVFGAGGVEPQDRFSDLLGRSARDLEVINMGVPGYSTDQEFLTLKDKGLAYHPDLVLLCLFVNDFDENFAIWNASIGRPKGYFSRRGNELVFHAPEVSALHRLTERSYALALSERAWAKLDPRSRTQRSKPVMGRGEEIETFKLLLRKTRDMCRAAGAEFVAVYIPFQQQSRRDAIREVLDELVRTDRLRTLDLTDYLKRADAKSPAYFRNDVHLNERGNEAVSVALKDYLNQNRLLPIREDTGTSTHAPAGEKQPLHFDRGPRSRILDPQ